LMRDCDSVFGYFSGSQRGGGSLRIGCLVVNQRLA
jgi:hypothetical protein